MARRMIMNWSDVLMKAKECQAAWGLDFPAISIKLLEPYHKSMEQRAKMQSQRLFTRNKTIKTLEKQVKYMKRHLPDDFIEDI